MRLLSLALLCCFLASPAMAEFRAGAAAVDVTPEKFPVIVNGSFLEKTAASARDRLHARALVLDDGTERIAIVVVDSCMMPREFLDRVKELVAAETKIPTNRQLISATHTHTAPAVMGALGSGADPVYPEFLQRQIVQSVRQAAGKLTSAKVGWAVADAGAFTNNRQWILRHGNPRKDPFGGLTVYSNMHPGYENPDFIGPAGPTDPWLSLLAIRTADDKPLAVLANFSMHYFGAPAVSADYFGEFCSKLEAAVGGVAIMSQGTAGDSHWMDYAKPKATVTMESYAADLANLATEFLRKVEYRGDITLAMAEEELELSRRRPEEHHLQWARGVLKTMEGRKPANQQEVYAREMILLNDEPHRRRLKLQSLRIGDIAIAAIPNEVFALTGLKIKALSPLPKTFTIELANGSEGYIPPARQHELGGYTTWLARTASLTPSAEHLILEKILVLLEKVAGKPRGVLPDPAADLYAKGVLASKPSGYWRLGELAGNIAKSLVLKRDGFYGPFVMHGLPGPVHKSFDGQKAVNRSAHFPGSMFADLPALGDQYSVEGWVWNGFPSGIRDIHGIPFFTSKGEDFIDVLNVVDDKAKTKPPIAVTVPFRTWTHLLLTREGDKVRVYRDGVEILTVDSPQKLRPTRINVGGTFLNGNYFEGRIAEVAVYDRVLTAEDAQARVRAAHGK